MKLILYDYIQDCFKYWHTVNDVRYYLTERKIGTKLATKVMRKTMDIFSSDTKM